MNDRLAILGAGGHGRVAAEIALESGWGDVVFFDDAWPELRSSGSLSVLGNTELLTRQIADYDGVHVAIGDNRVRLEKCDLLRSAGGALPPLVHPRATVSRFSSIGDGSVVMAGAVINAGCDISEACILNTACTIDHDCVIHAGVHVSPGANLAGGVNVGRLSWIGIGAVVIQRISIGADVLVGAGSVIISAVPNGSRVVSGPIKTISK